MKNFFKPFLMAATVASLFFVSSCSKTCDVAGEELSTDGKDCIEQRVKFVGKYNTNETCTPSVTIGADWSSEFSVPSIGGNTRVAISNFGNSGTTIYATVSASSLTIESGQTILTRVVSGTGSISSDNARISATYLSDSPAGVDYNCTMTFKRQ